MPATRDMRYSSLNSSVDEQRAATRAFDLEPELAIERNGPLVGSMHGVLKPLDADAKCPINGLTEHCGGDAL